MLRVAFAVLAALALASTVSAATEGRITARLQPGAVAGTANQPWTATAVVRDGKRAFSGRVIFSIAGETGHRAIPARRTRRPGRYSARLVFPAGGRWSVSLRAGRRTIRLLRVDVKGAGPRISRPHGFELAEEHGDLLVPDMAGTGFYEVSLRTRAKTLVGRGFVHPMFLNFGPGGFLYVADEGRIWRFEPDGSKTPIAGNGTRGLAGDGGAATSAQLGGHGDFAFDAAGNLYISEYDNGVRVVTPDGRIDTLGGIGQEGYSGDGGPARLAAFAAPHGLDVLADGTVIVADSHNGVIRRIDGATRIVTTIARGFSAPVGVDARPDGSIYVADARLDHVVRIAPDGSRTQLGRALHLPSSVVVDRAGRFVYVSEFDGRRISRIDSRTGRVAALVRP
jgi:DNA-binding beta-propeller fold protein YncE